MHATCVAPKKKPNHQKW